MGGLNYTSETVVEGGKAVRQIRKSNKNKQNEGVQIIRDSGLNIGGPHANDFRHTGEVVVESSKSYGHHHH